MSTLCIDLEQGMACFCLRGKNLRIQYRMAISLRLDACTIFK
jgi:hypothetical protein